MPHPPVSRLLERFQDADGFVGYRSPRLAERGVPHLFTTRLGGGHRALDLGALDPAGRERLRRAAGAPEARLVSAQQVHGACALDVRAEWPEPRPEADALVTERRDVLLCVQVADCVPVLIARADGRRVAAVHAGWRGLVVGVIPRALEVLAADEAVAAIGPCLSLPHFEVGPEVAEAFTRAGLADAVFQLAGPRPHVDLRAAAALQLRAGGVELIDTSECCTQRDAGEFYSYRRDVTHGGRGSTGRLGALIGIAGAGRPGAR